MEPPCPQNSFLYNSSLCACNPGFVMDASRSNCTLFWLPGGAEFFVDSGVTYDHNFPKTIFSFEAINGITQSQALFLEATLVSLLTWLGCCFALRLKKVEDGKSHWFKLRYWISRLDFCYATHHWVDDQKPVAKRKTELGGTLSVACWILFVGLVSALLYHIITKRAVEVHNVKASNVSNLLSFVNDMEFNITTVSSMSCAHLHGLGSVVTGIPGFIDHRVLPLSMFANYSCHNSSMGPTISLSCKNCRITRDNLYVSWQFVDLPKDPATAVGFQFNLTAQKPGNNKHVSSISGTLKSGSATTERPTTFRGVDGNVLNFHMFPQIYRNVHNLRLIQPLFHEFLPGSSFVDANKFRASLDNSNGGLINITIYISFISDYIIEVDSENVCEYRIKKLRYEDATFRKIRSRRLAQKRWNKLRKYVMYTWGSELLDEKNQGITKRKTFVHKIFRSMQRFGSLEPRRQQSIEDHMDQVASTRRPLEKNSISTPPPADMVKSCLATSTHETEYKGSYGVENAIGHEVLAIKNTKKKDLVSSYEDHTSECEFVHLKECINPLLPLPEIRVESGMDIFEIQKNLRNLYEYNVKMREKFLTLQSLVVDVIQRLPPTTDANNQKRETN
ncbi:hypothetical protein AMTRI_Chr06g196030 [Amborella trichopoda]